MLAITLHILNAICMGCSMEVYNRRKLKKTPLVPIRIWILYAVYVTVFVFHMYPKLF